MAVVDLRYTILDDSGDTSTFVVNLPVGETLVSYREFAGKFAELVDQVISGKVESAEFCLNVDISGLATNTIGALSDVEETASFLFDTDDGTRVQVNIPAIAEGKVIDSTDDIDLADPQIMDFVTAMVDGVTVTGATISPSDIREVDIRQVLSARETFRSSARKR